MLFIEPIWFSVLIPILFALLLLGVSLVVRQWRPAGVEKATILTAAAVALVFVTGGALFTVVLIGSVLFTHWIAFAIEGAVDRRHGTASPRALPARGWLVVAVAMQLAMVPIARASVLAGSLRDAGTMIVPFGVSYFAFHGISYVVDVYRRRAVAERSRRQL